MKHYCKRTLFSFFLCLTVVFPAKSMAEIGLREGVVYSKNTAIAASYPAHCIFGRSSHETRAGHVRADFQFDDIGIFR